MNQIQCGQTRIFSRHWYCRARTPLEAHVGQLAEPERAVDGHRVVDVDSPLKGVRIVVGHLVGGQVGPHLQHADRDVAAWRARYGHRQAERRHRRRADHERGGKAGPAAHQRCGDADNHRAPGERAENLR